MATTTIDTETNLVSSRRARFREAVAGLSDRARSSELQRMLLLPGSLLVAAGFAFMIAGWWGASHTHREVEQIPYLISGGIIGLALTVVGTIVLATAVWTSLVERVTTEADARAARQLRELEERLTARDEASAPKRTARLKAK